MQGWNYSTRHTLGCLFRAQTKPETRQFVKVIFPVHAGSGSCRFAPIPVHAGSYRVVCELKLVSTGSCM